MANIILNLPFDEGAGSTVAYDYSSSRADGVVHDAQFVSGRNGNAISFDGEGYVSVNGNATGLNIASDNFTVLAYVNTREIEVGSPSMLIIDFKFDDDTMQEKRINVTVGSWVSVAITREAGEYRIYMNGQVVETFENEANLCGFGINQDFYGSVYGFGLVDDFKMYDDALTQAEIIDALTSSKQQAYYIDGVNIKDVYGVCVSGSEGVLNRPKIKQPASVSRDNEHGEIVFLDRKYFEPREITLNCFMKANGKNEFIQRCVEFERLFDKTGGTVVSGSCVTTGTNRLTIDVHPIKPLIYEVYVKDAIEISKTWNEQLMVGTFKLKLIEAQPLKRVLKHFVVDATTMTVTITLASKKYVNIYWGDGSVDYDVTSGSDTTTTTITHTYAAFGEYFPVIAGSIDDIAIFTTNAIIVWSRL